MTTNRRRIFAAAVVLVLAAGAVSLWSLATALRVADANRITNGMTFDAVVAELGRLPIRQYFGWAKPGQKSPTLAADWDTMDGIICVSFADGRTTRVLTYSANPWRKLLFQLRSAIGL